MGKLEAIRRDHEKRLGTLSREAESAELKVHRDPPPAVRPLADASAGWARAAAHRSMAPPISWSSHKPPLAPLKVAAGP